MRDIAQANPTMEVTMDKFVETPGPVPLAAELAAQIALAAATGLAVAIVLSGVTLLLAGVAPA
jgi:hypothetical protein